MKRTFHKYEKFVYILLLAAFFGFIDIVAANDCGTSKEKLIMGLAYGPFRDGQGPNDGIFPTLEEMREDMPILKNMANTIRTYSVTNGFENIVGLAEELGLEAIPGAWITRDEDANKNEIDNLILLNQENNNILLLVVGNEAVLRYDQNIGDPTGLPDFKVVEKINEVKGKVSVPVTTSEPWSTWINHPTLANAVDTILIHIHPYWEGKHINDAANFVLEKYNEVIKKYPDKRVIISETGWPSGGLKKDLAEPGPDNQERFVNEFLNLAKENKIDFLFFEAFDEKWKEEDVTGVGPHWGLYFSNRNPKYSITTLQEKPLPDVKANSLDGPITINTSENLSVTVALNPQDHACETADWWVVVKAPFGWYHYDVGSGSWMPGLTVTYQGTLFDLPQFEVLNMTGLPDGTYTFYFGVDTNMNGSLDSGSLFFDFVVVNITVTVSPCTNIAGNWFGTETVTVTCCLGGDCETETISVTDTITIQQSGCNISYDIDTFSRTGSIQGNKIQMSGPFAIPLVGGVDFTQNIVAIEGTINGDVINATGSAIATGSFEGMNFSCTGNSTAVLTRATTSSLFIEKETSREPSLLFLNNSLNLFFTASP